MESKQLQIPNKFQKKLKNHDWLKKQLLTGKTGQQIFGFSDSIMDFFYTTALKLFEKKLYQEASHAFLFLTTLNPMHYDYWLGLGAAIQHCGNYEGAIDAFELAAICQLENPFPYFHLANCLFAMHDRENALKAIEMALEFSHQKDDYEDLYRKALAAKELLIKAD